MKQKEITEEVGCSSFTLQHYWYNTKTQSSYKSNNPEKPPKTSNELQKPQMTSKDAIENDKPSENVKTKNNSRLGDLNDEYPNFGRDLIEQAFSSPLNGRSCRIYKKRFKDLKRNIANPWKTQ